MFIFHFFSMLSYFNKLFIPNWATLKFVKSIHSNVRSFKLSNCIVSGYFKNFISSGCPKSKNLEENLSYIVVLHLWVIRNVKIIQMLIHWGKYFRVKWFKSHWYTLNSESSAVMTLNMMSICFPKPCSFTFNSFT